MVWTIELNLDESIEWYEYETKKWQWGELMPVRAGLFRHEYNYIQHCFVDDTEHKLMVF